MSSSLLRLFLLCFFLLISHSLAIRCFETDADTATINVQECDGVQCGKMDLLAKDDAVLATLYYCPSDERRFTCPYKNGELHENNGHRGRFYCCNGDFCYKPDGVTTPPKVPETHKCYVGRLEDGKFSQKKTCHFTKYCEKRTFRRIENNMVVKTVIADCGEELACKERIEKGKNGCTTFEIDSETKSETCCCAGKFCFRKVQRPKIEDTPIEATAEPTTEPRTEPIAEPPAQPRGRPGRRRKPNEASSFASDFLAIFLLISAL